MSGFLEAAVDWVVGLVRDWGYPGIFVMMAVESSFFPFPSEVAMIPAGYLSAQGEMDPFIATGMYEPLARRLFVTLMVSTFDHDLAEKTPALHNFVGLPYLLQREHLSHDTV